MLLGSSAHVRLSTGIAHRQVGNLRTGDPYTTGVGGEERGADSGASPTRKRQATLGHGVMLNGAAQLMPLLTSFALTPYLVRTLGSDGFGFWSLLIIFLATLTSLDGGVGASLARFFAMHAARGERENVTRLLIGAAAVFVLFSVIVLAVSAVVATSVVRILDIDPALRDEAAHVLRWLGVLVLLGMWSNAVVALLQAHARFLALLIATVLSSAGYVIAVFASSGMGLNALIVGVSVRFGVLIVIGLVAGRHDLRLPRPLFPPRQLRREFFAYASRMQASSVTTFLNSEVDAILIGVLLPVRYVGIYAVGAQAAAALRALPLVAFHPILRRLTTVFTIDGLAGAVREFRAVQERWLPAVLGYGAVATVAVGFGVSMWLGPEYRMSGVVAAVLMAGFTVHVALTGVRTCFVRAIGRPGLETRYSLLSTVVNLALTVPMAIAFGAVGVVSATTIALSGASLYFVRACERVAPLHRVQLSGRWVLSITGACIVTLIGELAVMQAPWRGTLPLAIAVVPAVLGLGVLVVGAKPDVSTLAG